jgi:hypothetical protein
MEGVQPLDARFVQPVQAFVAVGPRQRCGRRACEPFAEDLLFAVDALGLLRLLRRERAAEDQRR